MQEFLVGLLLLAGMLALLPLIVFVRACRSHEDEAVAAARARFAALPEAEQARRRTLVRNDQARSDAALARGRAAERRRSHNP